MMRSEPGLTTISLFTGAGGLDLGLEAAGFENAAAVEMDEVAVRTLWANRDRWGEIVHADIHDLLGGSLSGRGAPGPILVAAGLEPDEADLLAGGPPCQPFSKSGYWASGDSKRLADPRARTLDAYFDVLEQTRPRAFLLENVPGIAFNAKAEGLTYVKRRLAELNARAGTRYTASVAKLNAAEYGVPQLRERVFVIGARDGRQLEFPAPTHRLPAPVDMASGSAPAVADRPGVGRLLPATTAWDALGHLEVDEADPELAPRGKWAPVLATIPEGANYLWHTDRGGGIPLWGWRRRYWSMLLKLAKNRPSWTLTAQPGPAIGPFHWNNRRLATSELAALQTLPADYRVVGNNKEAHKQLGNAVPSALAEVLGRQIRRQLFDHSVDSAPSLLPTPKGYTPPPEAPAPAGSLPARILRIAGDHGAHPGTGLGPGAAKREASEPSAAR